MARYIWFYYLNYFHRLNWKVLALEKHFHRPETGNLRKKKRGHADFIPAIDTSLNHRKKKTFVSKLPPEAFFGVNSFFPGKAIMDLRSGRTWKVFLGYV